MQSVAGPGRPASLSSARPEDARAGTSEGRPVPGQPEDGRLPSLTSGTTTNSSIRKSTLSRLTTSPSAPNRLRRLAGQVGLSPEDCRRVQAACVQAAAHFGSELWWKGDGAHGTGGCPEGDQPRSKAHTGSLPDGQPRSPQPGIGTQASAGTTGQPPPARQPTKGRPSQGTHRSPHTACSANDSSHSSGARAERKRRSYLRLQNPLRQPPP